MFHVDDEEQDIFGTVMFTAGDKGPAYTPQTRMSSMQMAIKKVNDWAIQGTSGKLPMEKRTPTSPQAIPDNGPVLREMGWQDHTYQVTPKGGRRPEGPEGTYKTSETQRRASRNYLNKKPTLTLRCDALEAQVSVLQRKNEQLNRRLEELEEFCAKASTILEMQ